MISHLAACTATAIVAVLAAVLFARRSARWRHAILFVAVVRFAVPTGWLTEAGAELVRFAPHATPSHGFAEDVTDLLLAKHGAAMASRTVTPWKPTLPISGRQASQSARGCGPGVGRALRPFCARRIPPRAKRSIALASNIPAVPPSAWLSSTPNSRPA